MIQPIGSKPVGGAVNGCRPGERRRHPKDHDSNDQRGHESQRPRRCAPAVSGTPGQPSKTTMGSAAKVVERYDVLEWIVDLRPHQRLPPPSDAELIAGRTTLPSRITISTTFSLCTVRPVRLASVVRIFLRLRIDHFTRRWVGEFAVDAERDPAGLIAQANRGDLFRRHHGRVEDVQFAVRTIGRTTALSRPASVPHRGSGSHAVSPVPFPRR